jgi:hypothetical protein
MGDPAGRPSRRFYVWTAYACAAVAVAGFLRTYWAPVARSAFAGPGIVHLHGLLFTAWTIVFILQARSAAAERYERHRALGYAGIALASAMLLVGLAVVTVGIRRGIEGGFGDAARRFSIVPATIVLGFAIAFAFALAYVRRPEVHMRLMVVATTSLLTPAIARILAALFAPPGTGIGMGFPPPPLPFSLVPSVLSDLFIVAGIVRDWRRERRVHPAYLVSGALLLVVQVVRIPVASTTAWWGVTEWLLGFAG